MKKLSILLSTINDRIYHAEKIFTKQFADTEFIVVHQVTNVSMVDEYNSYYRNFEKGNIKFIQRFERGTGKSRNIALQNASGELFFICDDDIEFMPRFIEIITEYADKYPVADIFTYMIQTTEGMPYKKYFSDTKWHTIHSSAKVSNVEMVIRRNWHQKAQIQFDERFGLGTKYNTGEELVFLSDALKQGAKAIFIPEYIVSHPKESSGKTYSVELIQAKGAMIARVYGWKFWFINLAFAIKKYKEYKSKIGLIPFTKNIYSGSLKFLRNG